ncbi:hypothetical protein PQX77_012541 [Marasmius sp. AFHP31]|nr:hypothetical protein PQX77_012541 [Marasmius sp. AFHP31]
MSKALSIGFLAHTHIDIERLWARPSAGDICIGPIGPKVDATVSKQILDHSSRIVRQDDRFTHAPVTIDSFSPSSGLVKYLSNFWTDHQFLLSCNVGISLHMDRTSVLVPPGSIVRLQDHIILATSGESGTESQQWQGMPSEVRQLEQRHIDEVQMEDGRTRLTINPGFEEWDTIVPSYEYSRVPIRSDGYPDNQDIQTWLAQAPGIIQKEGINCGLISHIALTITTKTEASEWLISTKRTTNAPQTRPNDIPCYLFLLPIPLGPTKDLSELVEWKSKNFYYWSFDPQGGRKLSHSQRRSLGLPNFRGRLSFFYYKWGKDIYDSIAAWQKFKGFEPRTAGFAASLGLPILRKTLKEKFSDGHFKIVVEDGA